MTNHAGFAQTIISMTYSPYTGSSIFMYSNTTISHTKGTVSACQGLKLHYTESVEDMGSPMIVGHDRRTSSKYFIYLFLNF